MDKVDIKTQSTRRQILKKAGVVSAFIAPTILTLNISELSVAASGIPTPYPNTSGSNGGSTTVTGNGNPAMGSGSYNSPSTGDDVGTTGGVGN